MLQPNLIRTNGKGSSNVLNKDTAENFANGEYVIYVGFGSDSGVLPTAPTFPGMTWTQRVNPAQVAGYGVVGIWTARAPVGGGSGTLTCRATWSGTGGNAFACHWAVFGNVAAYADWWATRNSGTPNSNIIQRQHNSVIYYANVDWNVVNADAGRTYRIPAGASFSERHYNRDAQQTTYAGYYYNLGEPNDTLAIGMTAPAGQKWGHAAVEVYGYNNPKAYVSNGNGTMDPVSLVGFSNGNGTTSNVNEVILT